MSGGYYDIDAILTDAQKIPCTFNISVPGLGYLESPTLRDLSTGTTVLLPLWMASQIILARIRNTTLLEFDVPQALSPRVINALKADPRSVDLRALATHFYGLGIKTLELLSDEEQMCDVLANSFKIRAREVSDHAHNPRGALGEGADFLRGLDEMERQSE
ncbi:DNA replication complex GINS protein-like protein psf3 [Terfezia boudieri ATCC MYA-4762]|uniref:DNA replication complex GINS protein PSF3 n=1 Tax=Terfezia boudieri ATCC MYA-4762 TaxID=1051890 RepID=A0A3N4LLI1_9PEZI|nr:DNA replication complex GINS protein-like protein psf3 [Terfezia boudieri ATCC MYA-4762]